ncbi:hypothetical protein [Teichococcus aestuarii]
MLAPLRRNGRALLVVAATLIAIAVARWPLLPSLMVLAPASILLCGRRGR